MSVQKTSIPCVEKLSPNTYRCGVMVTVTNPDGTHSRKWIRETHKYDPALSQDQKLALAAQDLAALKHRLGRDNVSQGKAAPIVPMSQLPGPGMTIAKVCALWQQIVLPGESSDYTRSASSLIRQHILPHIGTIPISELTPLRISIWVATLQKKKSTRSKDTLSDRTVRHCYITLSTICNWAVSVDIIEDSPMRKSKPPKARKHRPAFLTDDQAVQLLRCLSNQDNMSFRCAVLLALTCGLRLGEVGALTWSDVDFKRMTIDISKAAHNGTTGRTIGAPKTDDSIRLINAPAAMMALLTETRAWQQDVAKKIGDRYNENHLIVCDWDGSPLAKDTPSRQWRRFADSHGFIGVTFHNLRTTHATLLMASGIDAVAIASRLGHSDASTTLRYYTMVVSARDKAAADAMDKLFQDSASDAIPFE